MTAATDTGNFDKTPPIKVEEYDKSIRLFCPAYEEMFKLTHSSLRARLPEKAGILIVGAGTGMEICEFTPLNPGWSFKGVDPSQDMLDITTTKLCDNNLSNHIELIKGYVDDLEDKETFDAATSILVMHFHKDDGSKLEFLKSISKRLKHGAPFVLIDGYGDPSSKEFIELIASWKQYPVIHGVPKEAVETAFNEVIMKMVRFVPETRILELMKFAGFTGTFKFYSGFLYGGWIGFKE
jgi:tRNA (cmo5U34)-methyltransferase